MLIGGTADVTHQRQVVDVGQLIFGEPEHLAESDGQQARTQRMLHGLADIQVDRHGEWRDDLGQAHSGFNASAVLRRGRVVLR